MAQRVRKGLATWLTGSSSPIFVLDHRRVVLVFNRGCELQTGWSAGDVIGKTCQLISRGNPELIETLTGTLCPPESVLQGESVVVPSVLHRKSGESQHVNIHFFPLVKEDSPTPSQILGLIQHRGYDGIELVPPSLLQRFELEEHLSELHRKYASHSLIAVSAEMRRVAAQAQVARNCSLAVHLVGEKGVGKEHVARMIHYDSPLGEQRFLPVECGTLSHFELSRFLRRLFEQSETEFEGCTVYLKNVELLAGDLQVELLDHMKSRDSIRWISSSEKAIENFDSEHFQRELICELTPLTLAIPPLRDRQADLPLLATHLLQDANRQREIQIEDVSEEVLQEFECYQWPENVEELSRVLFQAQQACSGAIIEVEHLPVFFQAGRDAQSVRPRQITQSLEEILEATEREIITQVLDSVQGNKSMAAERLQVPRAKLYRRLAALGIESPGES